MNVYGKKAVILKKSLIEAGIINSIGRVKLELMDVSIDILDKSATGNLLQEWLSGWMSIKNFDFRVQLNTQAFPDFFLSESESEDLLEVKSFDYTKSPNFDIANFDTYSRSITTNAYRLDADYLVFGYELDENGLIIRDVWLKKVWEMCCESEMYPLRTQVKQNMIHNIRPYNFKSMSKGYQPFVDRISFVTAIRETLRMYKSDVDADAWFSLVEDSYFNITGQEL